jgi:hypothetical protein
MLKSLLLMEMTLQIGLLKINIQNNSQICIDF